MLCPFCQREVAAFAKNPDTGMLQCTLADCPGRDFDVPNLYVKDYDKHPPLAMSIIGPTNHGKTMFIEGLLTHLEEHVAWPRFSTQWMDETNMAEVRQRLRELRGTGAVARATGVVFPRPRILRLRNIPRVGGCQLLMYDTGGESFRNAEAIQDAGRYVRHSAAVVWIVSLTDLQYPQELSDFMTSYAAAMDRMGTDPQTQAVVIALTKGDRLANPGSYPEAVLKFPALPAEAKSFLEDDLLDPASGEAWDKLERVHVALEEWFAKTPLRGSINLMLDTFRSVKFCILSAQGSEAVNEQLEFRIQPRGILSPLFWLWRLAKPSVWVESADGKRDMHYDFLAALEAAPEKATIELEAGTIALGAPLMLVKQLTIRGKGIGKTRIDSSAEKYAFGIKSPLLKFQGISFGRIGDAPGDVFRVSGGRLAFESCEISGGKTGQSIPGDGIVVTGTGDATVLNCSILRNAASGISVREPAAKAVLRGTTLSRNQVGLTILAGNVELDKATIADNLKYGIDLKQDARLKAVETVCRKNGKAGLRLDKPSAAKTPGKFDLTLEAANPVKFTIELRDFTSDEHTEHGIDLHGAGKLGGTNLTCRKNGQAGLRLADTATAEVAEGTFAGNQFGLVLAGDSRGVIRGVVCEGNLDSGIMFAGEAQGWVLNSTFRKHAAAGLRVEGKAVVEHAGNSFEGNAGGDMVPGPLASLREYKANKPTAAEPPPKADKPDSAKRKSWW